MAVAELLAERRRRPVPRRLRSAAVRVVDLDRDMADVIPTGTTRDSEHLFARMTELTLARATPPPGGAVLDVASGFGQDSLALADRGARVVGRRAFGADDGLGAAPERQGRRRTRRAGCAPSATRCPFRDGVFDAVLCKGAIDHFDRPELAIAEMARVTKPRRAASCSRSRTSSRSPAAPRAPPTTARGLASAAPTPRGRRHYDVPADHFTRYDLGADARAGRTLARARRASRASRSRGGCRPGRARVERLPADVARRCARRSTRAARACARGGALPRATPTCVVLAGRRAAAARRARRAPRGRRPRCARRRAATSRRRRCAPARARRARARASGCSSSVAIAFASASGSSGGTSMPPPPVAITSGSAPAARRDDRRAARHRLRRGQAEALVARRHHDERRAPVEADELVVRDAAGDLERGPRSRARAPSRAPRCAATVVVDERERASVGQLRRAPRPACARPCSDRRRGRRRGARRLAARRAGSGRNSSVSRPLPTMRSRSRAHAEVALDLARARAPTT